MGEDWEQQILDQRIDIWELFRERYLAIQQELADAQAGILPTAGGGGTSSPGSTDFYRPVVEETGGRRNNVMTISDFFQTNAQEINQLGTTITWVQALQDIGNNTKPISEIGEAVSSILDQNWDIDVEPAISAIDELTNKASNFHVLNSQMSIANTELEKMGGSSLDTVNLQASNLTSELAFTSDNANIASNSILNLNSISLSKIKEQIDIVGATISSALSWANSLYQQLSALDGKIVTVTINTIETSGTSGGAAATGTKNAKGGPTLVDDGNGAELIEHKKTGTFELGTDNGPRIANLDKGDIVHTAEETKKILNSPSPANRYTYLESESNIMASNAFSGLSSMSQNPIKWIKDALFKMPELNGSKNTPANVVSIGDIIISNPVGDSNSLAKELNNTLSVKGMQVVLSKP